VPVESVIGDLLGQAITPKRLDGGPDALPDAVVFKNAVRDANAGGQQAEKSRIG